MAKIVKKKKTYLQKLLTWGGSIIVIQTALLIYTRSNAVGTTQDFNVAVDEKLATQQLDDRTKIIIKVDLALGNFKMRNNKFPEKLEELVPTYLKELPIDPSTGKVMDYGIDGQGYVLAKEGTPTVAAKTTGTTGIKAPKQTQEELIASLDADTSNSYIYDPNGKRDPFKVFNFTPKKNVGSGNTDLEQVDYSELKLSGVILGFDPPKAIIEANGKGHTVTIGTKVGINGGEIVKIESTVVTVLESVTDFTGERKTRTVQIK